MGTSSLVCAILSDGSDPLEHELWPAFAVVFRRANARLPMVVDLYASASCPCCF